MSADKKQLFISLWHIFYPLLPEPTEEYNFDKEIGRKHRFDFAWTDCSVAVEVNGNAWGVKGGGRHGQDKDLEKLNLAVAMGWKVYQFSPAMLNTDPDRWLAMVADAIR